MKYKLINKTTQEETLCDKVTIDGFDYYVSDELPKKGDYHLKNDIMLTKSYVIDENCKKIISTNNPNIDIPKVVDEVERLDWKHIKKVKSNAGFNDFISGYNKSQETHPFSEQDMIEFGNWLSKEYNISNGIGWWHSHESEEDISTKELPQLWKEQRQITLYYEQ